jgi:hypothetical protein
MRGTVRFGSFSAYLVSLAPEEIAYLSLPRATTSGLPGADHCRPGAVVLFRRPSAYADGASTHDYVLKLEAHEDSSALLSIFGDHPLQELAPECNAHLTDQSVEQMARGEDSLSPRRRRNLAATR